MTEPIALVEWFDDHWYKVTVDGNTRYIPSVTTKLGIKNKDGLGRWRGDVGNREADLRVYEAGQRGKRLHWARAILLQGGAVVYDPWQNPVYTKQGIIDLEQKHAGKVAILRTQDEMWQMTKLSRQLAILKPKILGVEFTVYDLENNDAGTIDGVYEIEGGEYMINGAKPLRIPGGIYVDDFKSGNYLDDNVWYQLAPYAVMAEKRLGLKIAGALVTHTGANSIKSGIPGLSTKLRPRETLFGRDYGIYRNLSTVWEAEHKDDQPEQFSFPSILTLGGPTK